MSGISATVSASQAITASVSGGSISASVPASAPVAASVSGGVGPQGPAGPSGSNSVSGLSDVTASGVTDGDLLRYSQGKWRNHAERDLILDGENF